jgi:hypothetical protein
MRGEEQQLTNLCVEENRVVLPLAAAQLVFHQQLLVGVRHGQVVVPPPGHFTCFPKPHRGKERVVRAACGSFPVLHVVYEVYEGGIEMEWMGDFKNEIYHFATKERQDKEQKRKMNSRQRNK